MDAWLASSRERAPEGLAERIAERIRADELMANRPFARQRRHGLFSRFSRWFLVPTTAAAAVGGLLLLHEVGIIVPREGPGHDAVPSAAPPVIGRSEASKHVPCQFRFRTDGQVSQVCLVGTFNQWVVCRTPLKPQADGTWGITVDLPPGRYEYMFVVDGRWVTDPSAPLRVNDGFGNENAVLLL
jgi:hypothetical protein